MTPRKTAISIGEMRENEDESVDLDDLGTIFSDKAYGYVLPLETVQNA
jgi:hypothetical protein